MSAKKSHDVKTTTEHAIPGGFGGPTYSKTTNGNVTAHGRNAQQSQKNFEKACNKKK